MMLRKVSCLVVGAGLLVWLLSLVCFSQTEQITITTYYPSPFGVYNELRAKKMVIGEVNSSVIPAPNTDGVVIFKGLNSNPSGFNDKQGGALYYNSVDNKFKYYDSAAGSWKDVGEGISGYTIAIGGGTVFSNSCGATWGVGKCGTTAGVIDWGKTGCNDGTMVWQNGNFSVGRLFLCVKSF